MNPYAQALGRLARGHRKTLTDQERARRAARLADMNRTRPDRSQAARAAAIARWSRRTTPPA